jgi:hypothetical protein
MENGKALREAIGAGEDGYGLVLNGRFSKYSAEIRHSISSKTPLPGYLSGLARKHLGKYNRATGADSAVVMVHPFYLFLAHGYAIDSDEKRGVADSYLRRLMDMVRMPRGEKTEMVFLDSPASYLSASSLLLERGEIDRVIFTREGSGLLDDLASAMYLDGTDMFAGGMYNRQCLHSALTAVRRIGRLRAVIGDLVLNSPTSGIGMEVGRDDIKVGHGSLRQDQVIESSDAIRMFSRRDGR